MKRKYIVLVLLFFASMAYSQVAYWSVHPRYSKIKILGNGYYVVSKDGKFGMLDSSEKEVIPLVYDSISKFSDHYALLFKERKFVAYASDKGVVTDVSNDNYSTEFRGKFIDGHLLVKNQTGYYFINGETHAVKGPYSYAYPFSEGYARVGLPKSRKHIFDGGSFHKYLSMQDEIMELPIEDASIDEKNNSVDFLSTISNGKSIAVIKKRVYEYNVLSNSLIPLSSDDTQNKKSRIFTKDRPVEIKVEENSCKSILLQKGHMEFDPEMRLLRVTSHGSVVRNNVIQSEEEIEPESSLKSMSFAGTDLYGLSYKNNLVLTAQFENVYALIENEAIVMVDGKYGVVKIAGQDQCQFMLNDNVDLGFEHKMAESNIKVICPSYMDPSLISLTSADDNCLINVETRKENKNVESSSLRYACSVNIPEDIDLNLAPSSITIKMTYDGLKYVDKKISFNAWYINNYSVDIIRHPVQNSIMNLDVIVKNSSSGSRNYFKDVTVETEDSVISTIAKVSEEQYNVKVFGWKSSVVRFDINVTEYGCPTITYPFRIETGGRSDAKLEKNDQPQVVSISKRKARSATPKKPAKETKRIFVPN